jgi:hypothetical protein
MSFAQELEMSREAWANCIRLLIGSGATGASILDGGANNRRSRNPTASTAVTERSNIKWTTRSHHAITGLFILKTKPVSNCGSLWGFALIG